MKILTMFLVAQFCANATMIVFIRFNKGVVACADKQTIDASTRQVSATDRVKVFKWGDDMILSTEGTLNWSSTLFRTKALNWDSYWPILNATRTERVAEPEVAAKQLLVTMITELNSIVSGGLFSTPKSLTDFGLNMIFVYRAKTGEATIRYGRVISDDSFRAKGQLSEAVQFGDTSRALVSGYADEFDAELYEGTAEAFDELRKHPNVKRFVSNPVYYSRVNERESTEFAQWYIRQANEHGGKLSKPISIGSESDCLVLSVKTAQPSRSIATQK